MAQIAGPLLLVGAGKMGMALLDGWLENGLSKDDVLVVEPSEAGRDALAAKGISAIQSPDERLLEKPFRALILAVKPQMMADVLPAYRTVIDQGALLLSIAAGTSIERFEAVFGGNAAVIRVMPNTPAAIGQGVSAVVANAKASDEQGALAEALMLAVGEVHWLDDEEQMHGVTAMSGGGPAYVFLLIETLAKAGIKSGLPEKLAWPMARATVIGSGALAAASEEEAAILRKNVTSPGGTTQAALGVLMAEDGVQPMFDRAIAAGAQRSRDLG